MYSPRAVRVSPTYRKPTPHILPSIMKKNANQRFNQRTSRRGGQTMSTPVTTRALPIARNYRVTPRLPVSRSNGTEHYEEGDVEFASLSNTTTFTATRYELNPGLSATFGTRLANIAAGFEKYRLDLTATYIPAEAVTTTAGRVYLAAEYDPNDDAPATLQALSTYQTMKNGAVYEKIVLPFSSREMFSGVQVKKIRTGPVPGDLTVHDPGALIVCTDSGANTNAIGKVWLHYRITFSSPQTSPTTRTPRDLVVRNVGTNQTFATTVSEVVDFDEAISSGFTVTDASGTLTLPPGAYNVFGQVTVTNTSAENTLIVLSFLVNSAATTPIQEVRYSQSYITNGIVTLPFFFYASSLTAFTVAVSGNITGAAGTLVVSADNSRIFLKAV